MMMDIVVAAAITAINQTTVTINHLLEEALAAHFLVGNKARDKVNVIF